MEIFEDRDLMEISKPRLVEVFENGDRLASCNRFQVLYAFLEAPHLLFDNPELDIERLVKLHESIDVVVNLLQAVLYTGEAFLEIFYNRDDGSIVRLK